MVLRGVRTSMCVNCHECLCFTPRTAALRSCTVGSFVFPSGLGVRLYFKGEQLAEVVISINEATIPCAGTLDSGHKEPGHRGSLTRTTLHPTDNRNRSDVLDSDALSASPPRCRARYFFRPDCLYPRNVNHGKNRISLLALRSASPLQLPGDPHSWAPGVL